MLILILGYKTESQNELPEIVYFGNSGTEAADAVAKSKHARLRRCNNPMTFPVAKSAAVTASTPTMAPAEDKPKKVHKEKVQVHKEKV